jgi:hypothetical protein
LPPIWSSISFYGSIICNFITQCYSLICHLLNSTLVFFRASLNSTWPPLLSWSYNFALAWFVIVATSHYVLTCNWSFCTSIWVICTSFWSLFVFSISTLWSW